MLTDDDDAQEPDGIPSDAQPIGDAASAPPYGASAVRAGSSVSDSPGAPEALKDKPPMGTLWHPEEASYIDSLESVVTAHSEFLEVVAPTSQQAFLARLKANPPGAWAEAAVFAYLRAEALQPEIHEDLESGGADFVCRPKGVGPFLVEATALDPKAVAKKSGLPEKVVDQAAGAFSMITPQLQGKAKDKAAQVGGQNLPAIVAVCLSHPASSMLLDQLAANWLLFSEPKIMVPIGEHAVNASIQEATDLKNSAFLKVVNGVVVPARQSISAILLIAIWETEMSVFGMLHPEPAHRFDYRILPDVPFLRVAPWPLVGNHLGSEWVIAHPAPAKRSHKRAILTDKDLKKTES